MLIWQGLGFLAAIIPIVCYVLFSKLITATMGLAYTNSHSWPGALATLIGAGCVWLIGKKFSGPERSLVDPKTGQTVILKRKHTLFWIPIEYFAGVLVVVAIGMLIFRHDSSL
jgi:hypothetical protein